jgi:hypothetical protein
MRSARGKEEGDMKDTQRPSTPPPLKILSERTIEPSGWIVLECSGCGEHLILLGREEDWPKEHRDAFDCSGCGSTVTLAHRIDGTAYTIKRMLRSSVRPLRPGA